ncbi:dihydroxyacetone kinase-like protein [Phyllobacterium sp. 1468]|uniref:dihydroxyacetone kinase subunit DhaK n=1 Tax=Phyllobacterium sp. 1468 TaxID=2817759 RepID=UPI00285958B7|nr:dihydroxyacetone kinase subunit DhaK [Phyllobacterium sp. 1468]MDR6632071.1 dihydroxyacetone kinase-like protein [Phyllobacterium sp. 1468]
MKKFMNKAASMVAESLEGFVSAHDRLVVFGSDRKFVRRSHLIPGKVAIISGGGAGHEPMHIGFVGRGMLDAACTGHIFTSPTPDQIVAAIEETDTGAGCLLIVKNYDGDLMNFEMAAEAVTGRHVIETVIVSDDIAVAGQPRSSGRRGVAGTLVVEKILGAAAEARMDLAGLKALGDRMNTRIRTMGVALGGVTVPDTARSTFVLNPDEMEVGVGIHGEPGLSRQKLADADTIAGMICNTILADIEQQSTDRALVVVNGFGGTPTPELYLIYNIVRRLFEAKGISVARSLVGTYVTSLDMAGLSVTLSLLDEEELHFWDSPVSTAALQWSSPEI